MTCPSFESVQAAKLLLETPNETRFDSREAATKPSPGQKPGVTTKK